MHLDDLTIGQAKELRNVFLMGGADCNQVDMALPGEIVIAVLDRGWVVVGRWRQRLHYCSLNDAAVIRRWGTTKGLGEIAENGPTEKTVLDKCPTVTVHHRQIVLLMTCEQKKWAGKL